MKRLLGELYPFVYRKISDLKEWKFRGFLIDLPFNWDGDLAVFETEIFVEDPSTYLEAWFGGESLVKIDGKACGQINPLQKSIWLGKIADGKKHEIRVEVVPRGLFGSKENSTFEYARLVVLDEEILSIIDFTRAVLDLAENLNDDQLSEALFNFTEDFLSKIHVPRNTPEYLSYIPYNPEARPEVEKIWNPPSFPRVEGFKATFKEELLKRFEDFRKRVERLKEIWPNSGKLIFVGHSHIDYAWLWPISETKRKLLRTFSNALLLMEKHRDFVFTQSSAQMYEDVKDMDKDLYSRISEAVEKGRWEIVGGTWIEFDSNVPSMGSLVRQFFYGQKFFEKEFGKRPKVLWLPDIFGFSYVLPQIIRDAGMDLLITTKLSWNESNEFPYDICIWRGIDGSEILYYSFKNPDGGYNSEISAKAILETWKNHRQKHLSDEILVSFGYGDGGGGPSDEMMRKIYAFEKLPAIPKIRIGSVEEFRKNLMENLKGKEIPVWDGELYLELHRGTYTSASRVKKHHREAEKNLEALETLNAVLDGDLQNEIDEKWKVVLRNEAHDILPGTSINEVHSQAERELEDVSEWAKRKMEEIFPGSERDEWITIFNPSLIERKIRFQLEEPLVLERDGKILKPVRTFDGKYFYSSNERIEQLGFASFRIVGKEKVDSHSKSDDLTLENEFLKVRVGEDGGFTVYSKIHSREAFKSPARLWLFKNVPYYWDNWDIDVNFEKEGFPLEARSVEVVEENDIGKVVLIRYEFDGSTIDEYLSLENGRDVLDIYFKVDWHTRRSLLKLVFDLNVLSRKALFDIDGGYIERSTTRNTNFEKASFEVPHHRWVSISQNGFGVAILNDLKYGSSVNFNRIGLSLIKAGIFPDFFTDEGKHEFRCGVFVHSGDVDEVIERSEDFRRELYVFRGRLEGSIGKLEIEGGIFNLLALKKTQDGTLFRFVEVAGRSGRAEIKLSEKRRIFKSNVLEDKLEDLGESSEILLDYEPFKMHTFIFS